MVNNILFIIPILFLVGCTATVVPTNDAKRAQEQEINLAQGDAQVPPPAITNWTEKRFAKLIQEMRDHPNLPTWTYTKNMDGKYTFVCESIGYGLPYHTRTNNPQHYEYVTTTKGAYSSGAGYVQDSQGRQLWGDHVVMPQPEPNGLFFEGGKGTWNLCKDPSADPKTAKGQVTYQEEDVAVFPFKLPPAMVEGYHGSGAHEAATKP